MHAPGIRLLALGSLWLATAAPAPGHAQGNLPAELSIHTQGDQLAFEPSKLQVKAGQTVRLTFTNQASSDSRMQHGWMLLKPGTEEQVAEKTAQAGSEKNFIPDSQDILAHTRLLNAGESQVITFKAPASPGNYPFICPFPGHAVTMRGSLEVR